MAFGTAYVRRLYNSLRMSGIETKVAAYYDYTLPFYKVFWHGETRALHFGIFELESDTFEQALINTNILLAQRAGITKSDTVLDAGCGVGGSVFWTAKNIGALVTGITLSKKQYEKALELRARYKLEANTTFVQGDYFKTEFPDNSFSVIWGIESICHAHHDIDVFLKEMRRILKPGGRLVIADGFRGQKNMSRERQKRFQQFCEGLAVETLITPHAFLEALNAQGFVNAVYEDKTKNIWKTCQKMYRMSLWGYPLSLATSFFGLTPKLLAQNNLAGIVQKKLVSNGELVYGIIFAKKPL